MKILTKRVKIKERQKVWSEEETRLALRFYLSRGREPDETDAGVVALSNTLRALSPEDAKSQKFRSANSVSIKIRGFCQFDPVCQRIGVAGQEHVAKLMKKVWHDYSDKPDALETACRASLERLKSKEPPAWDTKYGPGGEGEAHKALKYRIARDPRLIGLPEDAFARIEYPFPSQDRADLIFISRDLKEAWAVEVEVEGERATLVGAWQAAKYRTLLSIEIAGAIVSPTVHAVLAAHSIGKDAKEFCRKFDIEWREVKRH